MLVGHSVTDAEGRILTMDRALCDLLQRPAPELVGMNYAAVTHGDDVARNLALVGALKVADAPIKLRKRYIRPDAPPVWCEIQISRFRIGPDEGRLVGTVLRIAERPPHPEPVALWHAARRMNALIHARRDTLGEDLFADHAWMVLLHVYLAEAEGRATTVAAIGDACRVAPVQTLRWLRALAAKGLVVSPLGGDPVQLTATGLTRIERLLAGSLA